MDSQTQGSEVAAQEILEAPMKEIPRDPNKEADSDRVREGWEALPGEEQAVDFPKDKYHAEADGTLKLNDGEIGTLADNVANLAANRYAEVEISIRLPDGRHVEFRETLEPDEDGKAPTMADAGTAYARITGVGQHYLYDVITTEATGLAGPHHH